MESSQGDILFKCKLTVDIILLLMVCYISCVMLSFAIFHL